MLKGLLSRAAILVSAGIMFSLVSTAVLAQTTTGSITVQTMDATKALVTGAQLVLTDNQTGTTRKGMTLSSGTFTFEGLSPSSYHLTVEHAGFSSVDYDSIVVQAGVATPVNIILKVGAITQEVNVSAVSVPVIEVSSNTLSTSVDLTEVNDLPVANRSLIGIQALSPGFASTTGNGTGTFDGTPQAAYQANVDGINSTSDRFKPAPGRVQPSTSAWRTSRSSQCRVANCRPARVAVKARFKRSLSPIAGRTSITGASLKTTRMKP